MSSRPTPQAPPPSSERPRVSVIVMAYGRREFLPEALGSLLAQTLPRERFDVVVVKDFEDANADRIVRDAGWKGLIVRAREVGPKLWAGLEASEGELVALLDDDDLFEPDKLRAVVERFEREPELGYYNHAHSMVGVDGRPPGPGVRGSPEFRRQAGLDREVHVDRASATPADFERLVRANPGNNSSVTLRRAILEAEATSVRSATFSIDLFLLGAALVSPYNLAVDGRKLTRIRMHDVNTSRVVAPSFDAYFRSYAALMERYRSGNAHLLDMVAGRPPPEAERFARSELAKAEHFLGVARGDLPRGVAARSFLTGLADPARRKGPVASEALYVASPSLARALNYLAGLARWGR